MATAEAERHVIENTAPYSFTVKVTERDAPAKAKAVFGMMQRKEQRPFHILKVDGSLADFMIEYERMAEALHHDFSVIAESEPGTKGHVVRCSSDTNYPVGAILLD